MGQFGQGTMNDPLRHAMGMRSAQDALKMKNWNSWPPLFQNTIFHGEQDETIKGLRHGGSMAERLARSKELKELGNAALKSATSPEGGTSSSKTVAKQDAPCGREQELSDEIQDLDKLIAQKEKELRDLKKQRSVLAEERGILERERIAAVPTPCDYGARPKPLEDAITHYEKAAGILRFVECFRPDWKNDDGSYKGIEDEWLKVDASALEGDDAEAEEARSLVTSCYLNVALASHKLGKYDQMKGACDEILEKVNPDCVKALFRRAQARIGPTSAVDADSDAAIQDLLRAAKMEPQNQEVRNLLTKLRTEKKAHQNSEANKFAGLFDRGNVVTNDPRTEGEKQEINPAKLDIRNPEVQRMLDIRPGPNDL